MGIEFFGKVLSHKWQMIDSKKVSKHINESQNLGAKLLSAIRSSSDLNETLIDFTDELLGIAAGDGLLIKYDDTILRLGNVPDDNFCLALMEWLLKQHSDNTFYTYELHKHFPAAEQMAASASGILTVGFGVLNPCRIIWFRSEFVQSLDWGGNPNEKTLIMLDKDSYRLSPRKSFDKWTQAIKNRSKDWEVYHIEAANLFKSTFTEILAWRNAIYKQQNNLLELEVAKKAEEITGLYEQLLAQYNKLEAAAFEQSHVIRAPLSTMMGLLNLLKSETEQEEIMYIYGKLQEKMELLDQIIINTTRKLE
jgi:light-regulated signal transduction histidine kinase (bacteriophytochrome)